MLDNNTHPSAAGNGADSCTVYALAAILAMIASLSILVRDAIVYPLDFGPPSPRISDSGADPIPSGTATTPMARTPR